MQVQTGFNAHFFPYQTYYFAYRKKKYFAFWRKPYIHTHNIRNNAIPQAILLFAHKVAKKKKLKHVLGNNIKKPKQTEPFVLLFPTQSKA